MEVSKIKSKLAMVEGSKKLAAEDLKQAKIKEQELCETIRKLTQERDDAKKAARLAEERLSLE